MAACVMSVCQLLKSSIAVPRLLMCCGALVAAGVLLLLPVVRCAAGGLLN